MGILEDFFLRRSDKNKQVDCDYQSVINVGATYSLAKRHFYDGRFKLLLKTYETRIIEQYFDSYGLRYLGDWNEFKKENHGL